MWRKDLMVSGHPFSCIKQPAQKNLQPKQRLMEIYKTAYIARAQNSFAEAMAEGTAPLHDVRTRYV
jgi:hypothetical protein